MKFLKTLTSDTLTNTDVLNEEGYPYNFCCSKPSFKNPFTYKPSYIDIWYNIATTGVTKIVGNRTDTRTFDLSDVMFMVIDDTEKIEPSLTYNFTTTGNHKVRIYFRQNTTSLYCLITNRQYIENALDLSHYNSHGLTSLEYGLECLAAPNFEIKGIEKLKTNEVTSMIGVFQGSSGITSLNLSNWNTSNVTSMAYMFNKCFVLKTIGDLSNWNTSKVTNMRSIFNECSSLTSVGDLSNWDVSNVTSMYSMFYKCSSLTSVGDLSNWNTSACTNMSYMFSECTSLTSVGDLSNWDVSNVTDMTWMFANCPIENINIRNWNFTKVTSLHALFQLSKAKTIDMSNCNMSNVTDISYLFNACPNLTSVGDLSKWDTSKVTDMNHLFGSNAWSTSIPIKSMGFLPIPKGLTEEKVSSLTHGLGYLTDIYSCGKISSSISFFQSPLSLESIRIVLNALDTEVTNQTITFSKSKTAFGSGIEYICPLSTEEKLEWEEKTGWSIVFA